MILRLKQILITLVAATFIPKLDRRSECTLITQKMALAIHTVAPYVVIGMNKFPVL